MSEWVFKSSPMIFKICRPSSGFRSLCLFLVMIFTVVLFSRLHLYVLSSFSSFAFVSFKSNSLKSSSAALFCNWHHFFLLLLIVLSFYEDISVERKECLPLGLRFTCSNFFCLPSFKPSTLSTSSLFTPIISLLHHVSLFCDTQVFVLKDKMTNNNNDNIFHWHSTPLPSHVTHHPLSLSRDRIFWCPLSKKKQKDTEILRSLLFLYKRLESIF